MPADDLTRRRNAEIRAGLHWRFEHQVERTIFRVLTNGKGEEVAPRTVMTQEMEVAPRPDKWAVQVGDQPEFWSDDPDEILKTLEELDVEIDWS